MKEKYEIYNYALKLNEEFKKKNKDFYKMGKSMKKKSRPKISIILPNYNYEKYISEAIESVLNQDFKDFELIILDDGSTDRSLKIIKEYETKHPDKIKTFFHDNQENRGLQETYKLGISKARGEYIAFIEADDVWEPNYLSSKLKVFEEDKDVILVYNELKLIGEQKLVNRKRRDIKIMKKIVGLERGPKENPFFAFKYLIKNQFILTFSCFMVRKEFLNKIDLTKDYKTRFDWWILGQLSVMGKFYYQKEKLTRWRLHKESYNFNFDKDVEKAMLFDEIVRRNILKKATDYLNSTAL